MNEKLSALEYVKEGKKALVDNEFVKAKEAFLKALSLKNDIFDAIFNLAGLYFLEGDFKNSLKFFEKALALQPRNGEIYYNIGLVYQETNRFKRAKKYYERALRLNPADVTVFYNLSFIYLTEGDYKRGFDYYRFRYHPSLKNRNTFLISPVNLLDDKKKIENGRLFIYEEQGLGDMIQFIRFLPVFKDMKAKEISVRMPKPLVKLFSYNYPDINFTDEILEFDYHFPLMESGYILGIEKENIPYKESYLKVNRKDSEDFSKKYMKGFEGKKRVGIVWRTNLADKSDVMTKIRSKSKREIDLKELLDAVWREDLVFYSLQKEESLKEKELLKRYGVISLDERLNDFYDTALAIDNLDSVITIDTSVVHLSGAMGKETLLLAPFNSDWRWGDGDRKSFWYDSVRIFRKSESGKWDEALKEIRKLV